MAHTDPIADMLTRIRNAVHATHETVEVPVSKLKIQIAEVLKKEGFIQRFEVKEKENESIKKNLVLHLKYGPRGEKVITDIKRISKPGLRVYSKSNSVPRVFGGLGISILSTSKGLKTDREAKKENIGGEVLCQIW